MQWFSDSEHQPFSFEAGPSGALLIHGFMGTPAELRPLGRALAAAGISSRAIALPGFGADVARLGQVGQADWVSSALDAWLALAERYEHVSLVGFSMGAAVALHVAMQRLPERLVLLAPLWRMAAGDPRVRFLPLLKHVMRAIRPFENADFQDPGLRHFFAAARPDLDLDDPETQRVLRREVTIPTSTLDELRRLAAASPRLARQIDVPTLLIQGKADQTVRAVDTRELATQLAGPARLAEIESEHLIVWEQQDCWPAVRNLVVDFLSEVRR
jgi:carboxylesterase